MSEADAGGGRHVPVLLAEVIEALAPGDGELHVDGTFGAGGYAAAILEAADCRVVAIDRDPTAIAGGAALAARFGGRLTLVEGRFGALDGIVGGLGLGPADGVVLDIGVSSMQLDEAGRGFSFVRDGPLDMRMGAAGPTAADVVNAMEEAELARVLYLLGEERKSRAIARAIVRRRQREPFARTLDLAETVRAAIGGPPGRIHPATRTFQALRIFVNGELDELAAGLTAAERLLRPGGRLAVVTFHSLEDRIVKRFFQARMGRGGGGSRHRPEAPGGPGPSFAPAARLSVTPGEPEIAANPRARSARLRAGIRTAAPPWPADPGALGVPGIKTAFTG